MTQENSVLKEAERLHALGFAILWLKPKSKAPVKSKWTTGPRESWASLRESYHPGFNVGVRLGSVSKLKEGFLAVIDIDVKSTDPRHADEAVAAVRELFPALKGARAPQVMSGRGNGSSHLYIVTPEPAAPLKIKVSSEKVRVMMPSAAANAAQRAVLSEADLNEGWRMRPAWEIAIMGEGQQVVLPPSVHPDSGRRYAWKEGAQLKATSSLPLLDLTGKKKELARDSTGDWEPEAVDILSSGLSDQVVDLLLKAETEDRSAALFKVTIAMIHERFTDRQIMSVLTDRTLALGDAAYDHAQTSDRGRAANWIFNYTIKKARREADATLQFDREVETVVLSDAEAQAQADAIEAYEWHLRIERYGDKGENAGRPKKTLKNLVLILENEVSPHVFRRNLFSNRDVYGAATPWGGRLGAEISDDDALLLRKWFSDRYRFEPDLGLIFESMGVLALKNGFHPVREYVLSLEWDGVPRLDTWLRRYLAATGPEPYLSDVGRKLIVAMVARVFSPGIKFDHIPVFEGRQGIGKSSAARILAGEAWFADNLPDLKHPDARLNLQGKWLIEMGELANLKRSELETIKAYITSQIDHVRAPYGRKAMNLQRQSVFIGTTNESTYLKDKTGNRRFWPVEVGQCDFKGLTEVRDQLFAEAYFIFVNLDEPLWLQGVAETQAQEHQGERVGEDEEDLLADMFDDFVETEMKKPEAERFNFDQFRMNDLFRDLGPFAGHRIQGTSKLVGRIIRARGFTKWKSNGKPSWRAPRKSSKNGGPIKQGPRFESPSFS